MPLSAAPWRKVAWFAGVVFDCRWIEGVVLALPLRQNPERSLKALSYIFLDCIFKGGCAVERRHHHTASGEIAGVPASALTRAVTPVVFAIACAKQKIFQTW